MPRYEITTRGARFEINLPEGHSEAELEQVVAQVEQDHLRELVHTSGPDALSQASPAADTAGGRFLEGAGKAFSDVGLGATQRYNELLAAGGDNEAAAALPALYETAAERRTLDAPLMDTGAGFAGNLAGHLAYSAPVMALMPGSGAAHLGAQLASAGVSGGALGALSPTAGEDGAALSNTLMGGALGGAGAGAARAVAAGVTPQVSRATRYLADSGVLPTPGRLMGSTASAVEDVVTKLPPLNYLMRGAARRGEETFNRAMLNEVLAPLGRRTKLIGHEGARHVERRLSSAYDATLGKGRVRLDRQWQQQVAGLSDDARSQVDDLIARIDIDPPKADPRTPLPNMRLRQLRQDELGSVSGQAYKAWDMDIGARAHQLSRSGVQAERRAGRELLELKNATRDAWRRANPGRDSKALDNADEAWSRWVRVRDAVGRSGDDGLVTPQQLRGAAWRKDSGPRRTRSARGTAPMQRLARAGQQLPMPGRSNTLQAGLTLGGGLVAHDLAKENPRAALALAAIAGAGVAGYNPATQRLLRYLASTPGALRQGIGTGLRAGAPGAGAFALALPTASSASPAR